MPKNKGERGSEKMEERCYFLPLKMSVALKNVCDFVWARLSAECRDGGWDTHTHTAAAATAVEFVVMSSSFGNERNATGAASRLAILSASVLCSCRHPTRSLCALGGWVPAVSAKAYSQVILTRV